MIARFAILLLFVPIGCFSQMITEHLLDFNKSYSPLFSKEKGSVSVRLDMSYQYPNKDTIMGLTIDVSQRKIKLEGVNNSTSASGVVSGLNNYGLLGGIAALGLGSSRSFSYTNVQGVCLMDYPVFDTLIKNIAIIRDMADHPSNPARTIIFRSGKLYVGLDLSLEMYEGRFSKANKSYYLQVDDSAYKLSESEYADFVDSVMRVKRIWDGFYKHRTVDLTLTMN